MTASSNKKALYAAKKIIAQIVTDVVNLEDINYTVPEVQTLLDGITVGGHKIQDEHIALNQIKAWRFLFESVENGKFEVSREFLFKLHSLVAAGEALTWGRFRDGMVSISGTDYIPPKYSELDSLWNNLELKINQGLNFGGGYKESRFKEILAENHSYMAAMTLFADMAKIQFFYDGNKRTGRMMMSGILLSLGYPMINVPAKRKTEFNKIMIDFYNNGVYNTVYKFLISCIDDWMIEEFDLKLDFMN